MELTNSQENEYLNQIWNELSIREKKMAVGASIRTFELAIKSKVSEAEELPESSDHKKERLERLYMLWGYIKTKSGK